MDPKDICVLVSYNDDYARMAEYTVKDNIERYCQMHGYSIWIDEQKDVDNDRSPAWQKIRTSMKILDKFRWVFFIDTDCIIMNSDIKLESIIDEKYSFIVPAHGVDPVDTPIKSIAGPRNVITSQFFVKNDEHGHAILNDVWNFKYHPKGIDVNKFDYENREVRALIDSLDYRDHIKIVDEHLLNRFWYINNPFLLVSFKGSNNLVWKPDDFIVHVTGYKINERVQLLSDLNYFSKINHGYDETGLRSICQR
jgi:hypothetical protein